MGTRFEHQNRQRCCLDNRFKMKTIKHQVEIACSQERVFDLTQDYSKRLNWDSYLREAYLLNGVERASVGVDSYCKNRSGSVMISRYISFSRPNVAAVTMIKGPFILKRFSGAWNVKKLDDGKTLLAFTYSFELRGGLLGRVFLPVAIYLFSKDMKARLVSLKQYLESTIA
jgi:ribosome-associated toxin RatA of RatAB toxin-antitoxin module